MFGCFYVCSLISLMYFYMFGIENNHGISKGKRLQFVKKNY